MFGLGLRLVLETMLGVIGSTRVSIPSILETMLSILAVLLLPLQLARSIPKHLLLNSS